MSLRNNDRQTDRQIMDYINTVSPSFCLAKWYNATIWLGSGMTTSCHHPPAHKVQEQVIHFNPKALHNTDQKKDDRTKMLKGERPSGCEYCWKIEDMDRGAISDRAYKSVIYNEEDLNYAATTDPTSDFNLRTLEIAFDRTCQFACSYCNPAFSSTWVKDIRNNGPYSGLVGDGRNHFTHEHNSAQLYKFGESNPYVEAFFKWWETDLHKTLNELRITGGEPLMSGYTWKLIEWFKANKGASKTRLAINSNLGMSAEKVQEFLDKTADIEHLEVYTSNEAVGKQAEYIRDGLEYDVWKANLAKLLDAPHIKAVHVMCTINGLCLTTLPEFLDSINELKHKYGKQRLSFTLNILRFPSFQSALVLPDEFRTLYKSKLEAWLCKVQGDQFMHQHELNHTQRLIDYLDVVKTPHSDTFDMPSLLNDFKKFYDQYDARRGKNFNDAFPEFTEWYNSL